MSTILDALKKSEQERNRNAIPTLSDMKAPREPSRWPLFLAIVALLMICVLSVLVYLVWSSDELSDSLIVNDQVAKNELSSDTNFDQLSNTFSNEEAGLMSVSIVSYSDNAEFRFAIVNGAMVREGEFIQPGVKIEKILSDTVVFNVRGERFERSL